VEHCGICQRLLSDDLHLSIAQTTSREAAGQPDETVEERYRLLLCELCWSAIDDEYSACGKHFRALIARPA
jgi:hypothetical protein